jgi:hypothetical protein
MTGVSLALYSKGSPQGCGRDDLNLDLNFPYWRQKMDFDNNDNIGGYAVPVDPMDLLQCDSCQ